MGNAPIGPCTYLNTYLHTPMALFTPLDRGWEYSMIWCLQCYEWHYCMRKVMWADSPSLFLWVARFTYRLASIFTWTCSWNSISSNTFILMYTCPPKTSFSIFYLIIVSDIITQISYFSTSNSTSTTQITESPSTKSVPTPTYLAIMRLTNWLNMALHDNA